LDGAAMSRVTRFGVSVPSELLREFDEFIRQMGFKDRSKAIQVAMRNLISDYKWMQEVPGESAGAIILLFDHTVSGLEDAITHVQHHYTDVISSTMHIHLDEQNCLEIVALRGDSKRIRELAKEFAKIRGIKQIRVTVVSVL